MTNKEKYEYLNECGYDMDFDDTIVKLSIVSQYGLLPSQVEELSHYDFNWYAGALNGDTPLANLVHTRKMTTKEARDAKLTPGQMQDRQRWFMYLDSIRRGVPYVDPIKK